MKYCILRKVVFRAVETARPEWGFVLVERQGMALLLVPGNGVASHRLAICAENVQKRVFELIDCCMFPMVDLDLQEVSGKLQFLGEGLQQEEVKQMLKPEDLESI